MSEEHVTPSDLLLNEEAAAMARKTPSTMNWLRATGKGPKWGKLGKRVVYRRVDVEAWIESAFDGGTV